jgi:outer membrane lipoprotein SlyB
MKTRMTLTGCSIAIVAALALSSTVAQAQPRNTDARVAAVAQVQAFSVSQLQHVGPGSELEFALSATPQRNVSVHITGATGELQMSEVQPGRYKGIYTVRSRDKITAESLVTARIEHDGEAVTTSLDQSVVKGARSPLELLPKIAAFVVAAPDPVQPGDELRFTLDGSPGGTARAALMGVEQPIALKEVSRGQYEGTYTLRRQDRSDGPLSASGFLVANGKESTRSFERVVAASSQKEDRSARNTKAVGGCLSCGVIEAINVVEAKADGNNVVGTIAGGVVGGVLGHQVGGGSGKDIATIAGALGGAYAGNRVQNNMAKSTEYHVVVRLESGTTQTVKLASVPALKVGERVRLENNTVVRL